GCAWAHGRRAAFFFQAEDGIRDRNVTGVQTCALPISLLRLGLVYLHVGFLDDAIDEFQKALAIDPTDRLAEQRIGVALVHQGKYEEALRIFRQIPSDKNPDLWHYHVAWALLHLHQDRDRKSV